VSREPRAVMLDLPAQHAPLREELDAALRRVLDSGRFVGGPEVEAFERELAELCGARGAVGCASGSDALLLALTALGVGPGDDVVCPAFTFVATASAPARLGARPVFADVDPATLCVTPESVRRAAAGCRRLRAVVPVSLFGAPLDGPGFDALSAELGVPVLEDAAQSLGARDAGGAASGSRGAMAALSFYPSKNLGALGDAGAVLCAEPDAEALLRSLRDHGTSSSYRHERLGWNSRLDALQAAALRVMLPRVEAWNRTRREHAARYDALFAAAGARPAGRPWAPGGLPLRTPRGADPPARHVYHHYVVRVPASLRRPLRAHLAERGVQSAVYYPEGLHRQPCFAELAAAPGGLPETEAAARECLALPVHPALGAAAVERVAELVVAFLDARREAA